MTRTARLALAFSLVALPGVASAQAAWAPGSEVIGQPIQVTTNGIVNTIMLSPGGQARITTPNGHVVNAGWTAANGQMCLTTGAQECWPYAAPFQAGQPLTVTSSCNAVSTWTVASTNAPPTPAPSQKGERAR